MSKGMKIWLIVALSFIVIGCLCFGGVMSMIKWDFSKLTTSAVESNSYEVTDDFNNITISAMTSDVVLLPSDDNKCKVVCKEDAKIKHSVKVENNTLVISFEDNRKWYEHIGFGFEELYIKVYLPKNEYSALSINSTTGNIEITKSFTFDSIDTVLTTGNVKCCSSAKEYIKIDATTGVVLLENTKASAINLSLTTGDTIITDVECDNFDSIGSTGELTLTNLVAKSKLSAKRTTGDIVINDCDAQDIFIKTTTGSVSGTLLSEKKFITNVTTGEINVPNTTSGGTCKIHTTTGDVEISLK